MPLRIIHVAVGGRGRHWLDFVHQHPDYQAVACVDVSETALQATRALAGQEHGQFFTDFDAAVAQVKADAALITSPSFLHASQTLQALDAGLAVLVEKPFGSTLQEAVQVVQRAREVQRPVVVAENYRFFQAERTIRHLLDTGVVGHISSLLCIDRRDQPSHTQGPWVKSLPEPFFTEIAVHHFDSFRYLFKGQPVSIFARSYNPPNSDYEGNGAADAMLEMAGGIRIHYSGTMVATRYEYSLWIEGDKGEVWTDRRRVWWRARGRRFFRPVKLVPVPKGDEDRYPKGGTVSLLNQLRDAVQQGRAPETSGEDNLWTLAMLETAVRSAHDGRRVRIDDVFTPELQAQAGFQPT
jgi:predicted dehydrogenase